MLDGVEGLAGLQVYQVARVILVYQILADLLWAFMYHVSPGCTVKANSMGVIANFRTLGGRVVEGLAIQAFA